MTKDSGTVPVPLAVSADATADWPADVLAAVLDNLPGMVAFWDNDMCNVYANRAYGEWFRKSPVEIRGKHSKDVMDPELFAQQLPYMRAALAGEPQSFERTAVNLHGMTRHALVSYKPNFVNGAVEGFFTLITDVTERVNAQLALSEHAEQVALLRERARISDAVHDVVIQHLYAAALELHAAMRSIADNPTPRMQTAVEGIDDAILELRTSVHAQPGD